MTSVSLTVVIPSIPPRAELLKRALASVEAQTQPPTAVAVHLDLDHVGAAKSRNAALAKADTKWVAFLDDDDWMHPQHLDHLLCCAEETGADLVYPWFSSNGPDVLYIDGERAAMRPFDGKAREWLIDKGNFIPVTVLVRRQLLLDVGGFEPCPWAAPDNPCEDWQMWRKLAMAGANIVHLPEETWTYHKWWGHTSGRPWTG